MRSKYFIQVVWKRLDSCRFEIIDNKFFLLYIKDMDKVKLKIFDDELLKVFICVQFWMIFVNMYLRFEVLFYLEKIVVDEVFFICDYKFSYFFDLVNLFCDFKYYCGVCRYV